MTVLRVELVLQLLILHLLSILPLKLYKIAYRKPYHRTKLTKVKLEQVLAQFNGWMANEPEICFGPDPGTYLCK